MTRVSVPELKEFSLVVFVSKLSLWTWFTGKVGDENFTTVRYDLYLSRVPTWRDLRTKMFGAVFGLIRVCGCRAFRQQIMSEM